MEVNRVLGTVTRITIRRRADAIVSGMKTTKKGPDASVATPILQDVIERHNTNSKLQNSCLPEAACESADLYQDAGGGYNANLTFPQE